MKILLYTMNYHPELTGIGRYSGEMATWLAARGHDVTVVCAPPYYPTWKVQGPYSGWLYKRERLEGVTVYRCPLWVPRKQRGINRILHLLSFSASSLPVVLFQSLRRPDIVLTVAPAFACTPGGLLGAKISGAKSWLHIQDFEIDVAFSMGILKGEFARKAASAIESSILKRFDVVSSISRRMVSKLGEKCVPEAKRVLFPNWVDIKHITPLDRPSTYRKALGISDEQFVVLFSGSLVGKQGLFLIPQVAEILRERDDIVFVICGNGVMKEPLERACGALNNVRMLPLQPFERLSELLGCADVHLLPQNPDAEDLVLPSKLSGMLASGRPIVATCRAGTEIAAIVNECGRCVKPEDPTSLSIAIQSMADMPTAELNALGRRARVLAAQLYAMDTILEEVERLCEPSAVASIRSME